MEIHTKYFVTLTIKQKLFNLSIMVVLVLRSLRSRRLVRAGEKRASFEETPAQMAIANLFLTEKTWDKLPIGQSR